ncbi:MAG: hypothetical protein ACJ8EM_05835, partial [Sphingomicrobium sp.]
QVYATEFSPDELRQMIVFAGTPAGKHYLARTDFLDMDPALLAAQRALMSGLTPVINEFKKSLCAERTAKRIAAGDKKATCNLSSEPAERAS